MIETNGRSLAARGAILDTEAMATLALYEDAKQSRQLAREARNDAYQERLELMRQAAAKLRALASNAVLSGVWQGVAGLASAACSTLGAVRGFRAAGELPAVASRLELSSKVWDTAGRLAEVSGRLDPARICSDFVSAEKQELETRAEVAGKKAEEQSDGEGEARRLEESARQLLQRANDTRHAAAMAALRG